MRQLFSALFFVAVFAFTPHASAQALWNGTSFGMSVAEVQRAVPAATPPPSKPVRLEGGAEELLRLDGVELVNQKFFASFFFLGEKLTQVTLSLEDGRSFDSAKSTFDELALALRAKYGKELSFRQQRGTLNIADAEWMTGRTNINLFLLGVGKSDATLNVNYQVRISREAGKL